MKRLMLRCAAVLASVAALVCAGSVGAVSAEEMSDTGADGPSVQWCTKWHCPDETAYVWFHVGESLTLGKPKLINNWRALSVDYHSYLDDEGTEKSSGFQTTYRQVHRPESDVEVSWPILRGPDGAKTGYTVSSRIHGHHTWGQRPAAPHELKGDCSVTGPSGENRFHCYMNRRPYDCNALDCWGYTDWDLYLTDNSVNRLAEASGAVKTEGSVSLANGEFATDSQARIDGAKAIPAGKSTQFDAVRKLTDGVTDPARKDKARMTFQYALLEDGKPVLSKDNGQPLYVFGGVSNRRTSERFFGDSSCHFITLDDHIETNPDYTCTMEGAHPNTGITDGRIHYITDFTIKKK
jgi:hypothetical protein